MFPPMPFTGHDEQPRLIGSLKRFTNESEINVGWEQLSNITRHWPCFSPHLKLTIAVGSKISLSVRSAELELTVTYEVEFNAPLPYTRRIFLIICLFLFKFEVQYIIMFRTTFAGEFGSAI